MRAGIAGRITFYATVKPLKSSASFRNLNSLCRQYFNSPLIKPAVLSGYFCLQQALHCILSYPPYELSHSK